MGFLQKVFGRNKSAETIDSLASAEAALSKLNAERDAARSVIASASERRRQLLLADAADESILEIDHEADAARLTVERCDLHEPDVLNRIRELQGAARRELLARLEADLDRATSALDASISETIVAFRKYQNAITAIASSNFSTSSYPTLPSINDAILLNPALIENWRRERERLADAKYAAANPRPVVVAPTPAPVVKMKPAPVVAVASPTQKKRVPIKLTGPIEKGMVRVECTMNLVDFHETQCFIGDQFDITREEANFVLQGRAFKFVAGEEKIEEAAQ